MSEAAMLFRVAAGPQIGFGHLVRAVSLSRVLGTAPVVSLRGGLMARATARRLGCRLTNRTAADAITHHGPSVLVVDDPRASASDGWVRAARRSGVPVAAIADRGLGARETDLIIDGGFCVPQPRDRAARSLRGPRYMVLDPTFLARRRRRRRLSDRGVVAVALGGGAHARYGAGVVAELTRVLGPERVRVASGFVGSRSRRPTSQVDLLLDADVALVAGGVGLYEACCLGIPAVAVAVAPAQRGAIRAFARCGAAVDAGTLDGVVDAASGCRLARQVLRILGDRPRRQRLSVKARRVVDGRGSLRVAAALRRLALQGQTATAGESV